MNQFSTNNLSMCDLDSQVLSALKTHYELEGQLSPLPGYADLNWKLTTGNKKQYVIKLANTNESIDILSMQNQAMRTLDKQAIVTPIALKNTQQNDLTGVVINDEQRILRVLTFMEGRFYAELAPEQHSPALWRSLGCYLAQYDRALKNFVHSGARQKSDWDLSRADQVCLQKMNSLPATQVSLVRYFVSQFQLQVKPLLSDFDRTVIHNDANEQNILLSPESPEVIALIDLGDMLESYRVNEVAIACAYAAMNQDDPVEVITEIVKVYHKNYPLQREEIEALYVLVALRLCASLCNAASALQAEPDNPWLSISQKPALALLKKLKSIPIFNAQCKLLKACDFSLVRGQAPDSIIQFRQEHLSRTLSLSYQQPLKIVRGEGVWLMDEEGSPYLDMINNVCHVGHCHPQVVLAAQRQMTQLNTNTRFLHDNIVRFAEKLLATFPEPLSVCFFVNSGSEANELAFRLAKNYSRSQQLFTVEGAYHGNTNACVAASPYKFDGPGGQGAEAWVHKVALPDPYRGQAKGYSAESGRFYAMDVKRQIDHLLERDEKPGAFICESVQGVAGQIVMPKNYLSEAYRYVREAGGVCIADEVQIGFGRVGKHMWAFELQDVVPDIVTLGKPIGNGHPLAAVVTTPEIAEAFVNGMEYFNTFGGNPVSCAIGEAVLDIIRDEELRQNAHQVGEYFLKQLHRLAEDHPLIGDVRGEGLFIGVELVTNRESKQPATTLTNDLIEHLKSKQILLSTEGPGHNVLKIKPPIVFTQAHADRFLEEFEAWLKVHRQR